jgi:hypothetical protein
MRNQFLRAWALALVFVVSMAVLGSAVERPPGAETHVTANENTFNVHDTGPVFGPVITTSGGATAGVDVRDALIQSYFVTPARSTENMLNLFVDYGRRERTWDSAPTSTSNLELTSRVNRASVTHEVMQT